MSSSRYYDNPFLKSKRQKTSSKNNKNTNNKMSAVK